MRYAGRPTGGNPRPPIRTLGHADAAKAYLVQWGGNKAHALIAVRGFAKASARPDDAAWYTAVADLIEREG